MMNNIIIINQSLHGYDQGHSLLKSSISFNSDTKRSLLIMSDMSGSTMQRGFEEYITGYPLKELNMYAMTKTWYAPEMKRPGCVWSHTLFINFADLVKIVNISKLISLFKNPTEIKDFDFYNEPIELIENENIDIPIHDFKKITPCFIKDILFLLYKKPDSAILIQSSTPLQYENLVLSIWMQQWPRLKRNFSFCTGAISARYFNNRLLDLQIISQKLDRNLNTKKDVIIINPESEFKNNETEEWINVTYEDLISHFSKLRDFLNSFGADINESRSVFVPLVDLYIYFSFKNNNKSVAEAIKVLSKNFPSPDEAYALKQCVLNNKKLDNPQILPKYSEECVLFELATTDYYKSFDFNKLDFAERFQSLFKINHLSVLDILDRLISSKINPNGEIVLKAIAEIIEEEFIEYLNNNYRKLLIIFVFFNNQIAYINEFWNVSSEKQEENLYTLLRIKNINWQKVINILLELDAKFDKEILNNPQFEIVSYILNWANQSQDHLLNNSWYNFLKSKPEEVLAWLKSNTILNDQLINLIPNILNPNSTHISNFDSKIWLKIILNKNSIMNLDFQKILKFKSFILALALKQSDENTFKLLSYSFEQVYQAALNNQLDYYSWKSIEVHTEPLPFWQEWDKCKKLRNILVDKFIELNWPIKYLSNITTDNELIRQIQIKYKFKK